MASRPLGSNLDAITAQTGHCGKSGDKGCVRGGVIKPKWRHAMRAFVGAEPPLIQRRKPVGASFRRIRRSFRVFGRLASLGCVSSSSRPLFLQPNAAPRDTVIRGSSNHHNELLRPTAHGIEQTTPQWLKSSIRSRPSVRSCKLSRAGSRKWVVLSKGRSWKRSRP